MKTKTIKIYEFSELSDKAKQRAKDQYAESNGYSWADEAFESLEALTEHFGGKIAGYGIDYFDCSRSDVNFCMPELEPEEIEARLSELGTFDPKTLRGNGDCKLTGYCADENAIDGFRMAWHKGYRDLGALMQAAFNSWLKDAQSDCDSFYSDEVFSDHCEANNYEFNEDGSMA